MTADAIFPYLVMAVIAAVIASIVIDEAELCPTDAKLALAALCGALWPLTLAAVLALGLWCATCAIAASFAALWRAVRPPRASLPRATVRRPAR